ncbi:GntR family transcriptional regulator [Agrococcus sp. ARC_14]|uniref:GntR family transcriptional regulator n=1 Tax=Agrococcus sp. ARC_14 TaxID=2919927 RepID=UPI001F067615|nr:GntR family transcriptional regulator [Agrococcus sp. ARC_14]MCH1881332.1 GntR family transcriptional regulator [Agrococcus sp. ARC_14]
MDLAARIREMILRGELVPNQRLVELDLSDEFGASRPAVREALRELTGEGLVERVANRGARVRAVGFEEAIEIAEARRALESLCAGKAAEVVTDDEIAELQALGVAMEEAVAGGDRERYAAKNREMHDRVHEISGQQTAINLIRRLRDQNVRQQFRLAQKPGRPNVSIVEHLAIIDAIAQRDRTAAERAMALHLDSVIAAMHEVYEQTGLERAARDAAAS